MLAPIVFHMLLKTAVLPVKCTPARSWCDSSLSEIIPASPGTKLMTPGGSPASSMAVVQENAPDLDVDARFQTTVFPMRAGAVGRFPAIEDRRIASPRQWRRR